jgi:hypothetical protein
MTSEFKTNKISPATGTTLTVGDSGDTVDLSTATVTLPAASVTTHVIPFDDNQLKEEIALLGFRTAANGSLAKYNLVDQSVDAFEDASGVDAGTSTGELRDTAGKYYYGGTVGATSTVNLTSGTSWTVPADVSETAVLVVAGGGTGGQDGGGGGGAGGIVVDTDYAVTYGTPVTYAIGAGGSSGTSASDGANSTFGTLTAIGGGGGSGYMTAGRAGGSGGGAGRAGGGSYAGGASTQTSPSGAIGYGFAGGQMVGSNAYGAGGGGGSEKGGDGGVATGGAGYDASAAFGTGFGVAGVLAGGGGAGGSGGTHFSGGAGGGGTGGGNSSAGADGTVNTGSGGGGGSSALSDQIGGGGGSGIIVLRYTPTTKDNMVLVSNAITAETAPTKADLVMTYTNGAGTATINTDLKAYASRDDGTTWTQLTLASQGTTGGHTILSAHDLDISGQPSGTAMRYKITTHNQSVTKETRIQAVSLGWS